MQKSPGMRKARFAALISLVLLAVIPTPAAAATCEASDAGGSWSTAKDATGAGSSFTCDGTLTPTSDTADWYVVHFGSLSVPSEFEMRLCSKGSSYGFIVSVQIRTEQEKLTGDGPFQVFWHDQPKGGCSDLLLGDQLGERLDIQPLSSVYIRVWLGVCTDCTTVKTYSLSASHTYEL